MTIADEARDNALHCEMVKYAYRQTKDGVVVSFVVHPNEIPAALSISHIGARYMVALVQIGDDEKPIPPAEKEKSSAARLTPAQPQPIPPAGAKRDKRNWRDVPPSEQAFLTGRKPVFWAFLNETRNYNISSEQDAKEAIYEICEVGSRRFLDLPEHHANRLLWSLLLSGFEAWEARERVGA